MAAKSDYLENKLLNHVLGGPDFSRPASVYVAAYTGAPSDTGGGIEVEGTGYARVEVINDLSNWSTALDGSLQNLSDITFPAAGNTWGTVTHIALHATDTGDAEMLYWGALTQSKSVDTGNVLKIVSGTLIVRED